jgi:ubiquinone/menaquinone biosynthesis C-methylase UbiE
VSTLSTASRCAVTVWHRLVRFGFRLLYNELAWLYDPVSHFVSRGRWQAWQRSALSYLPPSGRVLEVGIGPGHMVRGLAGAGYEATGLEVSRSMLGLARRWLRSANGSASICQGRAQALPFASRAFDAVIVTFPTQFIYESATLCESARVLKTGQRLIIVLEATLTDRGSHARCVSGLYRLTGQHAQRPSIAVMLGAAGFQAGCETVTLPGSQVTIAVGTKQPGRSRGAHSEHEGP